MLYDLGIISQNQTGTQTGCTGSTLFVLLEYAELLMDNLAEHENVAAPRQIRSSKFSMNLWSTSVPA